MKWPLRIFLFILMCFNPSFVDAQPVRKSVAREKIDAKRSVNDINSADAVYRAREFIRLDSTYYVGWMYEGVYKYNHAADFLGYKNAIAPLQKALSYLGRDYAKQLRTRSSNLMIYYPIYQFQVDYSMIAGLLMECYSNINQPEKAFQVVLQTKKWRFQRNYYFAPYAYLAWIVHRNRFYTSANYPFLKNSIAANEALANRYLDSGLVDIKKNAVLNTTIFQPGYLDLEKQTIYHYKAILYSYDLQIDSAMHYYRMMMDGPLFSYNNYATFLAICGDFHDAMFNYNIARTRDMGDKRLQEWAYYSAILSIYQNQPDKAVKEMKDMIAAVGSTPGFGWYNIALARSESYNGDLAESERHAIIAGHFKEVNIGTTLGESQYNFSVNMVNLMNDIRRIQQIKFENDDWWYNIFIWPALSKLEGKKYMQQYLLVNQLALNPERDQVIYSLFSSENVVGWDEIWFLIRDFSTSFFYKKFESEFKNDKRRLIKKYYLLFMARLQMEQGKYTAAAARLQQALAYPDIDPLYDKLFLARCYEALSLCAKQNDQPAKAMEYTFKFYEQYPQIVPFSDVEMNFRLSVGGQKDESFLDKIKDFRINWTEKSEASIPTVKLVFSHSGNKRSVNYSLTAPDGRNLIPAKTYYYNDAKYAARQVAYLLFKIDLSTEKTI
ncbi:MAG TPA: hypothetical protein VFL76_07315 [Edaphocola sp.]|nr:hypothetical protein [Edaphocola sp.]